MGAFFGTLVLIVALAFYFEALVEQLKRIADALEDKKPNDDVAK